jgi:hypothetical protein
VNGLVAEGFFQEGAKITARDGACTKAGEMGRFHLTIDQIEAEPLETRDEGDQRRLGGVCHSREHRFAKERAAERDAVEATNERTFMPDLY